MAMAPSWGAVKLERPPRYLPIGVRTAERMTGVVLSLTTVLRVEMAGGNIGGLARRR
jgi:hypothetical protein